MKEGVGKQIAAKIDEYINDGKIKTRKGIDQLYIVIILMIINLGLFCLSSMNCPLFFFFFFYLNNY